MRKCVIVFIILLAIPLCFAHEEEKEQEPLTFSLTGGSGANDFTSVSPIHHFLAQRWFAGVFFSVMWIALIKGIYDLSLLVLSRFVSHGKK